MIRPPLGGEAQQMSRPLRQMKPDQVWRIGTAPQGLTGLCPGEGSEDWGGGCGRGVPGVGLVVLRGMVSLVVDESQSRLQSPGWLAGFGLGCGRRR